MTSDSDKRLPSDFADANVISIGVGELAVAALPNYLMTPALGSCVGVALYDSLLQQGGLAHIMLPSPTDCARAERLERFATVAVPALAQAMTEIGSARRRLVAKIAGGAAMFQADAALATIGDRNVAEVRKQLRLLRIPIVAEDVGNGHARTVELHLDTGLFIVRSYLYGVKRL
ncbi:MAG: chemotaxis protein CheD [Coriobacteriia bacterium]|nr:chemotaxis protein CheD [Coriobacteriia bacterium]